MDNSRTVVIFLSVILVAVVCIGAVISDNKQGEGKSRYIAVEGSFEREVVADLVEWTLSFERICDNPQEVEKKNMLEKEYVNHLLVERGISQDEIEIYNFIREDRSHRNHDDDNNIKYRVGYYVRVKSNKIDLIANLKNNISKMLSDNFGLNKNTLRVYCSNQEQIHRELAKEAALNAMEKAEDLVKPLKVKLGDVISIEEPRFFEQSGVVDMDGVGVMNRGLMAMKSSDAENNASEAMTKRKIWAFLNMKIAIK